MRTLVIAVSLALCGLVGMTAQVPSPSQPSGAQPSKSLRHLQYTFSVDYSGVTEYHYNGISDSSSGLGGAAVSQGGRGTMDVDVLSIAPDGALVIKIAEWIHNESHARQAFTCTVYGNTMVICPTAVPSPSDAEFILLGYLGRQFVDAAPWDAQHHWQRKRDTSLYLLVEDFTMTDPGNEKLAVIREKKKVERHDGKFGTQAEDIEIMYDRSLEVPRPFTTSSKQSDMMALATGYTISNWLATHL